MPHVRLLIAAVLAAVVIACSPAGSASQAPAASPSAAGTAVAAASPSAAAAVSAKVSANTATHEELVTALTEAGVANADRWAREVEEYRPYDAGDPTLAHLQDELAKYDPDPTTLATILGALQP